jgi:hypothetical protein
VNNEFDDVDALYVEKGFTSDKHYYLLVEGVCCVDEDKYRAKFIETLRSLPRDEIITRCRKVIRIGDAFRLRK